MSLKNSLKYDLVFMEQWTHYALHVFLENRTDELREVLGIIERRARDARDTITKIQDTKGQGD